jgi:ureidoacrylate peracid hydrolase
MHPLSAETSALVIVDYQNDFCHPDGAFGRAGHELSAVQALAAPIARLRDLAHEMALPVVVVRVEHSPWTDDTSWKRRFEGLPPEARPSGPVAARGSWGAQLFQLEPDERDFEIVKHRYSAFAYTPLELVLRARGCTDVVICGVQTDVCVLGTARDALQAGFRPVVVADAVGTGDPVAHHAALEGIRVRVGPLLSCDEVVSAWQGREPGIPDPPVQHEDTAAGDASRRTHTTASSKP